MTTTLTRLPGSKWWIETDDDTNEIIGQYNKSQITDRIQYLRDILPFYGDLAQTSSDMDDLLVAIEGKWTPIKNARIVELINTMWSGYQTDTNYSERVIDRDKAQSELDTLVALRDRLV
jgi:hypothetical protein